MSNDAMCDALIETLKAFNEAIRKTETEETTNDKRTTKRRQQMKKCKAWKAYCEGQEVGFKKAEDVFERMKLVQESVDCIRNTFNKNTESDKLVRNCMALVQNAIDGEHHDMEAVDISKLDRTYESNTIAIEIKDESARIIGMSEIKKIEITDEEIVKLIDRYFELKGIEIKEIGII